MKWKKVMTMLLTISAMATAQQRSEWFLNNHPYRTSFNPAERPAFKGFFAVPTLGNMSFSWLSSSITLSHLEDNGEYTINNSTVDVLANKAKDNNLLMSEASIPIMGVGFTIGQNYFTLIGKTRIESGGKYNKDLFALRYGLSDYWNEPGNQNYNVQTSFHLNGFHELAAGINRPIGEKAIIGFRIKYLKGFASIQADNLNMKVKRLSRAIEVVPNATIRTAIPTTITENEEGNIEDIEFDDVSFGNLFGSANSGWGIDLGATYRMTPKLTLGASITDIGKINWKEQVTRYTLNTTFTFSEEMIEDGEEFPDEVGGDYWEELRSTFMENMDYQENAPKYSTSLNTRINLTAQYQINSLIDAGVLGSVHHFADQWWPTVSVGGNIHPTRWLEATLYYTAAYKTMDNLGLGVNLNFGPVNLFVASDNIVAAFNYKNANYLTTRFGLNLILGRHKPVTGENNPEQ